MVLSYVKNKISGRPNIDVIELQIKLENLGVFIMRRLKSNTVLGLCLACLCGGLSATSTAAQSTRDDSLSDSSDASGAASLTAGYLASTGVSVVVAVAAIPSAVEGAVKDSVRAEINESLDHSLNDSHSVTPAPLEISPETIIAQEAPKVPFEAQPKKSQ